MKGKGARAERELLHMLFKCGWQTVRSAGSGSIGLPNPDLIAGKDGRVLAIECKSSDKEIRRYFKEHEIRELKEFAKKFNAEAWLAIRFDAAGWFFLEPHELEVSKNGFFCFDFELVKEKGKSFDEVIR